MDHIEFPSEAIWTQRQDWFEALFDVENYGGGYIIGEQATGLLVDLQAVYCTGAFAATIILACTVIDSHIRETELGSDFEGVCKRLLKLQNSMKSWNGYDKPETGLFIIRKPKAWQFL